MRRAQPRGRYEEELSDATSVGTKRWRRAVSEEAFSFPLNAPQHGLLADTVPPALKRRLEIRME
jgi:hypothetical protein